jgi:hypothetical protein
MKIGNRLSVAKFTSYLCELYHFVGSPPPEFNIEPHAPGWPIFRNLTPRLSDNSTTMKVLLFALTASTVSAFAPNAGVRCTLIFEMY